ncbi:unnamed protein product [Cylicocyclus nassatus]|uniref:Uncharacterized protein n=1 Tax=Cylicocyclus nassatus TaxID=53992 RepID=A0AA36H858_CYLNA|nr:unnamed protein product [Cylicocyclus nassatus]
MATSINADTLTFDDASRISTKTCATLALHSSQPFLMKEDFLLSSSTNRFHQVLIIFIVRFSYNGRIEERMPLMAIRLPPDFKQYHPREYANFLKNKWKLTSTSITKSRFS